jgi:hypothetical protein
LVTENGKVRMKVNLEIAKEAQLAISSKLLRPSQLVRSWKPKALWKTRSKRAARQQPARSTRGWVMDGHQRGS